MDLLHINNEYFNPGEVLKAEQFEEINRSKKKYPHLTGDTFVSNFIDAENRSEYQYLLYL